MKTFRQLRESSGKVAVITFGRFNPPTIGHKKMIDKLVSVSKRYGGDAYIFASSSQDAKKNPFPYNEKIALMRKMFPVKGHNLFRFASDKAPTVMHAASLIHDAGYDEMILVVGSDRVKQFQKLLPQYNGVKDKPHGFYDFSKLTIESAGERDPDADGAEGMSASKLRAFAIEGDFDSFATGIPDTLGMDEKRSVYQKLRKHMRLKVIESVIKKQSPEPIKDLTLHDKIMQIDEIENYLESLPFTPPQQLYVNSIERHVGMLLKEDRYFYAKNIVNKIKSLINTLEEETGMIDFEQCDMNIFETYLDSLPHSEFTLNPVSSKLQSLIQRVDEEEDDAEADINIIHNKKSDVKKDPAVKKKEDSKKKVAARVKSFNEPEDDEEGEKDDERKPKGE